MKTRKPAVALMGCVQSSEAAYFALEKSERTDLRLVISSRTRSGNSDFVDMGALINGSTRELCYVEDHDDYSLAAKIRDLNIDILFVVGWSRLVKPSVYSAANLYAFGYHPADLPKNRGRHPIIWSLVMGLEEMASCFFELDQKPDEGAIVNKKTFTISEEDNARSIYDKLLVLIPNQINEIVADCIEGSIVSIPQDDIETNTWRKRSEADGKIDFRMNSRTIRNLVRALYKPYEGADLVVGHLKFKVWGCKLNKKIANHQNIEPGKILYVDDYLVSIKTADGIVDLFDIEPEHQFDIGIYL